MNPAQEEFSKHPASANICKMITSKNNKKGSTFMRKRFDSHNYLDVKPWVIAAINDEKRCPSDAIWRDAPSAEETYHERLRRIKFLHKHTTTNPNALIVASRLEICEPDQRCRSGACPECGRLFQRWFVRRSNKFIAEHLSHPKHELVAVSIVPWAPTAALGQLHTVDVVNLQRRLKYTLQKAELDIALGGIDFSFNEDHDETYVPFWCPHFYFMTSTADKTALSKVLGEAFLKTEEIARPVKITSFENDAYGRSYALKMNFYRRIGYNDVKKGKWKIRKCRNTNGGKLKAAERLELFMYLDRIGLADRVIFLGVKPVVKKQSVKIEKC
jgi:hypothetical protein